jgi:hypothetical protein
VKPSSDSRRRSLPTRNVRWLLVRFGKTTPAQLRRRNLTDEQYEADEEARDASAFFKFIEALSAVKFKKRRSSILGMLVAEDLKRAVNLGLKEIIQGDAARLITQAVSQGDEAFFKALGRTLAGKKLGAIWPVITTRHFLPIAPTIGQR